MPGDSRRGFFGVRKAVVAAGLLSRRVTGLTTLLSVGVYAAATTPTPTEHRGAPRQQRAATPASGRGAAATAVAEPHETTPPPRGKDKGPHDHRDELLDRVNRPVPVPTDTKTPSPPSATKSGRTRTVVTPGGKHG